MVDAYYKWHSCVRQKHTRYWQETNLTCIILQHLHGERLEERAGVYITCRQHLSMLMRTEYESVWTDKETEETLSAEEVEFEVSGVVPSGPIVYCDSWGVGFSITGGGYDNLTLK